ncbi:hypothetical protein BJ912DRAFT_549924 [Pholiota molesta]|nr:hypothetical protein BJ912DRAFT_549924 [Pholiota molesta]
MENNNTMYTPSQSGIDPSTAVATAPAGTNVQAMYHMEASTPQTPMSQGASLWRPSSPPEPANSYQLPMSGGMAEARDSPSMTSNMGSWPSPAATGPARLDHGDPYLRYREDNSQSVANGTQDSAAGYPMPPMRNEGRYQGMIIKNAMYIPNQRAIDPSASVATALGQTYMEALASQTPVSNSASLQWPSSPPEPANSYQLPTSGGVAEARDSPSMASNMGSWPSPAAAGPAQLRLDHRDPYLRYREDDLQSGANDTLDSAARYTMSPPRNEAHYHGMESNDAMYIPNRHGINPGPSTAVATAPGGPTAHATYMETRTSQTPAYNSTTPWRPSSTSELADSDQLRAPGGMAEAWDSPDMSSNTGSWPSPAAAGPALSHHGDPYLPYHGHPSQSMVNDTLDSAAAPDAVPLVPNDEGPRLETAEPCNTTDAIEVRSPSVSSDSGTSPSPVPSSPSEHPAVPTDPSSSNEEPITASENGMDADAIERMSLWMSLLVRRMNPEIFFPLARRMELLSNPNDKVRMMQEAAEKHGIAFGS